MLLYQEYKDEFVRWAAFKFQIQRDAALDIFQDSVINFYVDIKQGKLTQLRHTVKTYLFTIAKHKMLNYLRYEKKFVPELTDLDATETVEAADQEWETTERKEVMLAALAQLGEPCHTLLKLFYFDGYATDAIAHRMGYKNPDVVKSRKLRCLNTLRQRIMARFTKGDL